MPTTPDEKRRRHIEAVKRCQATTDAIMIRPPLEDGRRIRQYADRNGVSVQALFLAAVADYMNSGKAPEPVKRGPRPSKPSGHDADGHGHDDPSGGDAD